MYTIDVFKSMDKSVLAGVLGEHGWLVNETMKMFAKRHFDNSGELVLHYLDSKNALEVVNSCSNWVQGTFKTVVDGRENFIVIMGQGITKKNVQDRRKEWKTT